MKAGEITALILQPALPLAHPRSTASRSPRKRRATGTTGPDGKGWRIGHYVADFSYIDKGGKQVIEEIKGFRTQLYKWKLKHIESEYGITITELRAR